MIVYDCKTHSLYDEQIKYRTDYVYFSINTVELIFEIKPCKLVGINGYLPLMKAKKGNIEINNAVEGEFKIDNGDLTQYEKGIVYAFIDEFPNSFPYFVNAEIKYDSENKMIQIGEMTRNDKKIKVNRSIVCVVDENENLKCLCICPSKWNK